MAEAEGEHDFVCSPESKGRQHNQSAVQTQISKAFFLGVQSGFAEHAQTCVISQISHYETFSPEISSHFKEAACLP